MFNKYQYLIREKIFKTIRVLPTFVLRPMLSIYVKKQNHQIQGLKTPLMLILYVTSRCNARCSHCFYWKEINTTKDELSLKQIEKIARSLKHPLNTLSLTGGEPFLRNDIKEIISTFVKNNKTKKVNIASNGYFTEKIVNTINDILQSGLRVDLNVQISLDGLRDLHNQIRGVDIFNHALKTIGGLEGLQKSHKNFHVTVLTTISQSNFSQIEELKEYIKEKFKTVHHGFQFIRSAKFDTYSINKDILEGFDPKESENSLLSVEQMKIAVKKGFFIEDENNTLLNNYVKVMNEGIIDMKEKKKCFVKCLAGVYDGVIYANGGVSMCEFTKPFANLVDFDYDFYSLWQSNLANKRRQQIKACFCGHTCNIMNAMRYNQKALLRIVKN